MEKIESWCEQLIHEIVDGDISQLHIPPQRNDLSSNEPKKRIRLYHQETSKIFAQSIAIAGLVGEMKSSELIFVRGSIVWCLMTKFGCSKVLARHH